MNRSCEVCGDIEGVVRGFTVCACCLAALIFPDRRGAQPPSGYAFVDPGRAAPVVEPVAGAFGDAGPEDRR